MENRGVLARGSVDETQYPPTACGQKKPFRNHILQERSLCLLIYLTLHPSTGGRGKTQISCDSGSVLVETEVPTKMTRLGRRGRLSCPIMSDYML